MKTVIPTTAHERQLCRLLLEALKGAGDGDVIDWMLGESTYKPELRASTKKWLCKAHHKALSAGVKINCRAHTFGIRITVKEWKSET